MRRSYYLQLIAVLLMAMPSVVNATPYASNVNIAGTTVTYTLNEPTDSLKYIINGGAPVASTDGLLKGQHQFTIPAGATFSIIADKNTATGYTIKTGNTVAPIFTTPGDFTTLTTLSVAEPQAGYNVISDDASPLTHYNSPRGVDVSKNPNSPNFGNAYISNSAAGANGTRNLGDGIYALHSDGSDAYGYGDTAQNPNTTNDGAPSFSTASSSSPYRVFVSQAGDVYVSDYYDQNSNAFVLNPTLTQSTYLLAGFNGSSPAVDAGGNPTTQDGTGLPGPLGNPTAPAPNPQYHGSIAAIYAEGSLAAGNLKLYTIDEDLTSAHVSEVATDPTNDRNSLWTYNIAGTPAVIGQKPTHIFGGPTGILGTIPGGGVVVDMDRGADGKFYISQQRTAGNEPGLIVTDASGNKLFDSLATSRTILANPTAHDILTTLTQIAVSPDQKYLAGLLNFSDVMVMPLIAGIPDMNNIVVVNTATHANSGRDIAFDAADNIYYVSSGQAFYRVLSPGGNTETTLAWNGTSYSFTNGAAVAPGVPGDYNGNGVVDAADYVVWRNNVGAATLPNRDPSASGTVGAADYTFWKAHFGNTSGAGSSLGGAAVPEPGVLSLALLGLLAVGGCRKRSA